MGRPAHQPEAVSRRQVEAMAAYGVPEVDIATRAQALVGGREEGSGL